MKYLIILLIHAFIINLTMSSSVTGQSVRHNNEKSIMTIMGTSSLHDWQESVNDYSVNIEFRQGEDYAVGINKVIFICRSASVTSDNSVMTRKTQEALQVKKYPEIIFTSKEFIPLIIMDGTFVSTINGILKLNGITRDISLQVTGSFTNGTLSVKGSYDLKMSDYLIKPPTALMGTIKTDNMVKVVYDLKFDDTPVLSFVMNK